LAFAKKVLRGISGMPVPSIMRVSCSRANIRSTRT
jgi:hypothetical protein